MTHGSNGRPAPGGPGVRATPIPGLLVVDLEVHGDARGWFKENWQRAKMVAAGLPDFSPVQHSVASNGPVGVTRGVHAEPWDKLVSVVAGRVFGAWVDLREGPTFGTSFTLELDEGVGVFVPEGVGNSYQTLTEGAVYSYLVNDHWSPEAEYTMLNLADPSVGIDWPIPLTEAVVSDKDQTHPTLDQVTPIPQDQSRGRVLVLGRDGQLGRALLEAMPAAEGLGREELDLADPAAVEAFDFTGVDVVVNAAAYTAVDAAETEEGRRAAWAANATGVAALARAAVEHGFTLVHYSTDYVFDGTQDTYTEDDPLCPASVYGASKAAGDLTVTVAPRHYLLRTSWVVGAGKNFVSTMADLAERGVDPRVVDDQVGRLTFTTDLAAATTHLLDTGAPYGTYNLTSAGDPASWSDLARKVCEATGHDPDRVTPVTTQEYTAGASGPVAPRPARSVLDLAKIQGTGFEPVDQMAGLTAYLEGRTKP
ncbi:dTDP-4-dehydrorhamnose reductase [Ornithinimicrobium sp. CNJ-824]|uniref:sugar nucleotide-binding protein n=1 Tax=Ornithinimicrobium sp. CNJ-824 TaxID=1904966 RepID=UPI00095BE3D3|nr:bifunctional dTDP-4-dehydrorhamnose 3,5-epimerase family protein/NAD(P)-dependent oxidoreductase [Ornithinimicrobium sp. CNJ-824]OLT21716.1 dTDP-4-dehydrorhamnose reductase [Ornithinimicrobium sp. CNJ-824]